MGQSLVLVFFSLQLCGALGILALLATVGASVVKRSMTWNALCVSLIVYSVSYSAVLFTGNITSEPSPKQCATQAAMIYGAPVLVAFMILAFHIDITVRMTTMIFAKSATLPRHFMAPWVAVAFVWWLIILGTNIRNGFRNPGIVERHTFYCVLSDGIAGHFVSGLVVGALTCAMILEGMLFWTTYHIRTTYRYDSEMIALIPASALIRISIITLYALASVGASFALSSGFAEDTANLFLASIPIAAFLCFASQGDILRAWSCYQKRHQRRNIVAFVPSDPTTECCKGGELGQPVFSRLMAQTPPYTPAHTADQA